MRYSTRRSAVRLLASLSSAILLVACDSGPGEDVSTATPASDAEPAEVSAPAAAGPENACALLTAADVQSIIGEGVRDSLAMAIPEDGPATASQCNYATAGNPAAASVLLRRSFPGETVEGASQSVRQTLSESGIDMEDVPGVGEVAFWGSNQLHVFVDDDWYLVITPTTSGGLGQARALAEAALPKL